MKVLHLMNTGGIGGTEVLCKDIAVYSSWENCFCFLSGGGVISDEMEADGAKVHRLYKESSSMLGKMRKILSLCKKEEFSAVIIQHFGLSMDVYFLVLKFFFPRIKGIKILHVVYEPEYTYRGKFKLIKKLVMAQMLKKCDLIIGVSKAGKSSFQKAFKIPEQKMRVVYNGISEALIDSGKSNKVSFEGDLKLLYIGRLSAVKGVHNLICAIDVLKDKLPIQLTVVGDGPERSNLETQVDSLKLNDYVKFVGPQRNISDYYKWCNLFIYPSVWQEVFGISIVEAMAFGVPCIANSVGGIPEIIVDGNNGLLTKAPNVDGLVNALKSAYEIFKSAQVDSLSECAKETANKFSIKITIEKMESLIVA